MEGNPETEPARGHDSLEGAGGDKLNQAQTRDRVQVRIDAVEDDPAKAHVQSWIKDQIETQPQQPPPEPQIIEPAADEAEADGDGEGDDEVPRAGANPNDGAAATDTTGTGARAAPTEPPVAVTPTAPGRTRTGPSTETSTSTTAVGHGLVPQFVAPSSYLRPRTSNRSAMAPTEPKPPSPLDRDQLQGLVCARIPRALAQTREAVSCRVPEPSLFPSARSVALAGWHHPPRGCRRSFSVLSG